MLETATCPDCGEDVAEGETLCQDCQDNYGVCDKCQNAYLIEEMVENNGFFYCEGCASRVLTTCNVCGEMYNFTSEGWGGMCEGCSDEHFICDVCDEVYSDEDYAGEGMCRSCYEESEEQHSSYVRYYHHSPRLVFHPPTEKLYFGVELETDGYANYQKVASELYELSQDETIFYMEEDSSLKQGIEIISQPCSLYYHKFYFPWEKIVDIVKKHGGKSHDTTTCGLHIHFSRRVFEGRKDKLYQIRLVYFFEKFWKELVVFSRREGVWEHNAKKYGVPIYDKPASRKLQDLKDYYSRYQAVNLVNRDTIEIRIFRGSLLVPTILASLELVDFLIKLVKASSNRELQSITWAEVTKRVEKLRYPYLHAYLSEKGLLEGGQQNVSNSGEA